MTSTYTKDSVQFHYASDGPPAVNVKVHTDDRDGWREFRKEEPNADPRFTEEWLEQNLTEEQLDNRFWMQCEWRWEDLRNDAEEIFACPNEARPGDRIKVYAEGRSGGWAVVHGLPDVEEWDAIMLGKWRKFERFARATAAYIPTDIIHGVYINEFEAWTHEPAQQGMTPLRKAVFA